MPSTRPHKHAGCSPLTLIGGKAFWRNLARTSHRRPRTVQSSRATSPEAQTSAGGRVESSASEVEPYDSDLDHALCYGSPEKDTSDELYEDELKELFDDDDTASLFDPSGQ